MDKTDADLAEALRDASDAELIEEALDQLPPEGLFNVRERSEFAGFPFSHGNLNRWDNGARVLKKYSRRKLIRWLISRLEDPGPEVKELAEALDAVEAADPSLSDDEEPDATGTE